MHPRSDDPSGKADALQKLDCHFRDSEHVFPSRVTKGKGDITNVI